MTTYNHDAIRKAYPNAVTIEDGFGVKDADGNQIELVKKGALDISRAETELGWKPKHDIRSGLAAYVKALSGTKEKS